VLKKITTLLFLAVAGLMLVTGLAGCDFGKVADSGEVGTPRGPAVADRDRLTYKVTSTDRTSKPKITGTGGVKLTGSSSTTAAASVTEGVKATLTAKGGKGTLTCQIIEDGKVKKTGTGRGSCTVSWTVDK